MSLIQKLNELSIDLHIETNQQSNILISNEALFYKIIQEQNFQPKNVESVTINLMAGSLTVTKGNGLLKWKEVE